MNTKLYIILLLSLILLTMISVPLFENPVISLFIFIGGTGLISLIQYILNKKKVKENKKVDV